MTDKDLKNLVIVLFTLIFTISLLINPTPLEAPAATTAQPAATATAQPKADYWALETSKAFKSIEYGCTLRYKKVSMPYGCVVVIDRVGGGYLHNGLSAPMSVVISREGGVTIYPANGIALFVEDKAKNYSFVVIDERGAFLAQQFDTSDPQWDKELLREFFVTQMGGEVETIWGLGLSDFN